MAEDLPRASAPLLTVQAVEKRYSSGTLALSGVDLAVQPGEFVSLLGPSGCGKSTLLRIIAGLIPASAGQVRWANGTGGPSDHAPPGTLSFVFQEPTLLPWASVADNVYLPLRLAGQSRAAARPRIADTLTLVGLDGFATAYPRELSGGMRMRVSIARALVTGPRVLLLDEPFAALDEITRFKLNDDLLRLWQDQRWTVIFVTHSVFESVFLSGRVLMMAPRPGRLVAEIPIDLPQPRDAALRTSLAYSEHCRLISERLAEGAAA